MKLITATGIVVPFTVSGRKKTPLKTLQIMQLPYLLTATTADPLTIILRQFQQKSEYGTAE